MHIDLRLSVLKLLVAGWLLAAFNGCKDDPALIKSAFEAARLLATWGPVIQAAAWDGRSRVFPDTKLNIPSPPMPNGKELGQTPELAIHRVSPPSVWYQPLLTVTVGHLEKQ